MTPAPQHDLFGREMKVGDKVVWATYTRKGGLQHGTIVSFPVKTTKNNNWNPLTRRYEVEVVEVTKIQVETTSRYWASREEGYKERKTKRTLDEPKRFAVMSNG